MKHILSLVLFLAFALGIFISEAQSESRRQTSMAATTSAVSWSIKILDSFDCRLITLKFDAAPTTSEDITVTLDSVLGATFDTVLVSVDPSSTSATSTVIVDVEGMVYGDALLVEYTNTDGNSITGTAACEL